MNKLDLNIAERMKIDFNNKAIFKSFEEKVQNSKKFKKSKKYPGMRKLTLNSILSSRRERIEKKKDNLTSRRRLKKAREEFKSKKMKTSKSRKMLSFLDKKKQNFFSQQRLTPLKHKL